jgi:alpha/beta hydrolase family protein
MAAFVLVHGAWHGGWCWQRLTPLLTHGGHVVYAPTLKGLGERAHLRACVIDLQTRRPARLPPHGGRGRALESRRHAVGDGDRDGSS